MTELTNESRDDQCTGAGCSSLVAFFFEIVPVRTVSVAECLQLPTRDIR